MRRVGLIVLALALLCASTVRAEVAKPCALVVGWEPYAPYTFADRDGKVTGADIDLIRVIAAEIGCTLDFAEMPWARIVREIQNGTLDVSTSTSWTQERTEWAMFSEPYRETQMAIYVRRGEASRFELKDLAEVPDQRFRLGVITGYYYGKEFADLMSDPDFVSWVDGATDYATNIRKLTNGRIDGYLVEDVGVMEAELARLGAADQVERYPLRLTGEKLRFMFSRRTVDPSIVAAVNAALARLRADGRLAAIMRQYVP
jgi:polar amino acid transport system substrate-binding protein